MKRLVLPAILSLGLLLRLVNINQSLWLDEAAQVMESARPLQEQFALSGDFQPPLFHLLLHFWLLLGSSELTMRLLTVSLDISSVFLVYLIGKKIVNQEFGLVSLALYAFSPFAIYYAQELRPYSLSVFLVLAVSAALIYNKNLLLILLVSLSLYTTYFTPFFLIALVIYILHSHKKSFLKALKPIILGSLLFLPWIYYFSKQLATGLSLTADLPGWNTAVSVPFPKALPLLLAKFFLGRITLDNKAVYAGVILLFGVIFFYLAAISFYKYKNRIFHYLFFIPLLLSLAMTVFIPIFDPKRLLFLLPFFIYLIVLGLNYTPPKLKMTILVIIVSSHLYGLINYYTNPRFQREQWRQAVSFIEKDAQSSDIALFVFPEPFAPVLWYKKTNLQMYPVTQKFVVTNQDLARLERKLQGKQRIYHFQYLTDLTDPQKLVPKKLEALGFINSQTYDFPGVGFIYEYLRAPLALAP